MVDVSLDAAAFFRRDEVPKNVRAARTAIIEMVTNSSTKVKPRDGRVRGWWSFMR
jgi:uncharacterized protein (UPF0147 family)